MVTKKQLEEYQIAYSKGEPLISDSEYDRLLEEYLKKYGEKNRPFLRNKQSTAVNDIVGTLPKVFGVTEPFRPDQKTYADWCLESKFPICVQPKFDGCSIALDCQTRQFFTRGDYDNGESVDVTDLFANHPIQNMIKANDFDAFKSVKFEAVMCREHFEQLKPVKQNGERYIDPRSCVSGAISSRNITLMSYIDIVGLRGIDMNGYEFISPELIDVIYFMYSNDYHNLKVFVDRLLEDGATVKLHNRGTFDVDGVVVSKIANDFDKGSDGGIEAGTTLLHPSKTEIAIKILNVIKETKILDIEYQFGLAGRITPVAKVEEVEFDGRKITSIGLSTLDRVQTLAMNYGDTVRVTYNIVPYLLTSNRDGNNPIQIPTKCPHCGEKFDMTTLKQVKCRNKKCVGMRLGSIIRYCQKINIFGIDRGNITKLWEAGVIDSICSLYELTIDKICSVQGFKEKSAQNIIDSIKKGSTNVDFWKWLGAWPMDDVGSRTWKAFLEQGDKQWNSFTNEFMETFTDIESIIKFVPWMFSQESKISWHGFGDINKMKMCKGMEDNSIEMKNVFPYITFKTKVKSQGKVCLSGTRNKILISNLQEQGWEVVDSMTKDVKVLLTTDMDSTKAKKAVKDGIFCLPINQDGTFEDFQLMTF